jgi:TDG/mug DNA glycosylase family protein
MIEHQIASDLYILFVGINPHPGSDRREVPFSNNKMFWYLLHAAGVLSENLAHLKDDASLKEIYMTRLTSVHRLGLINLIDRPSRSVNELRRGEELPGAERLTKVIEEYRPRVVCFVGKLQYQLFYGISSCDYGWQAPLGDAKIFVMHAPLRGAKIIRIRELEEMMRVAKGTCP